MVIQINQPNDIQYYDIEVRHNASAHQGMFH